MYFVYELSYKGIVFYVGATNYPYQRAATHLSALDSATWRIVCLIKENNELPDFSVAGIYENPEICANREAALIRYYCNIGVALCNIEWNDPDNIIEIYYEWHWRPTWRRKTSQTINTHISNAIEQYKAGTFRHNHMDNAASVSGREKYPSPKCSQLGSEG